VAQKCIDISVSQIALGQVRHARKVAQKEITYFELPGTLSATKRGSVSGWVHIVDDDPSFAAAVSRRLTQAGYTVTTHATAQHLLDNLPNSDEPSCLLIDVRLPDLDGPALQQRLAGLGSALPIIFLTAYADTRTVVQTLKAGALDFLTKPIASDDLRHTVEKALRHHQALVDQHRTLDGIRARLTKLTPRERQVFDLIVRGNMNKQIGRALGTTERTIKAHRQKVMEKMQVQTLAELVSLAERVGALGTTPDYGETA
jgi:FixJ family two-component response regulator